LSTETPTPIIVRDPVLALVMIIITGMIGPCFRAGEWQYSQQIFTRRAVIAGLATLRASIAVVLLAKTLAPDLA